MTKRNKLNLMFFIRRSKVLKNGEMPIYVRITFGSRMVDISIGKSVSENIWQPDSGIATGKTKEARHVNDYIDSVKNGIYEHYRRMLDEGRVITATTLKNAWLGKSEDEKTILGIYQEHNEKAKLLKGKDFAPATIQRYETSYKHVADYIKWKYKEPDIPLIDINPDFVTGLDVYLKTVRNCGHNSTMKYIKNFKKVIRIALANGWLRADPFASIKLIIKKVDRGFLTDEELNTIISKQVPNERLEHVKDVFVFGCFTGLAYADLKKLNPQNLVKTTDGKVWIHTFRKKTDNSCHIPLLPAAQEILEKYKSHPYCIKNQVLLPVYSNQKLNAYLKEIGTICDIGKSLSSHLARHTFATTVTLNNDVPLESVSKMLGHSSLEMTRIYARLLDKKVSADMSKLYEKY